MDPSRDLFDVTIIGSGPVGLYGIFYARLRGMKAKILDALPELGGQLVTLYPEKFIFDVAGFPRILARDLAKNLIEQALSLAPTVCLGAKVTMLKTHEEESKRVFELVTDDGLSHFTRSVVLTAGIGAFRPKRLGVPGIVEFEGKGIHYFVNEKKIFCDKDILIVGGGDSAVDWALNLSGTAKQITLIHRRDQFRAHEESVKELMSSPVAVKTFHELKAVSGNSSVQEAVIFDNRTGEEHSLRVDAIILNLGFHADLGPIKQWGLEIDRGGIKVNYRMETSMEGIFAAGDVASHPGKLKLISTGFGEVATAINFAKNLIDPGSKVFPGHSSDSRSLPSPKVGL
ncbi:MAG: NAD(P)/FAD-dependent oxidoreductase [Bacteroidetes bacterium]|nr:NAD(P)/FAD-dependent oxidoreductase [Bacteroidota bacterium]MCL5268026.1 NAD(P)/FAD-dependent oxidoreductase [Bacteroidota bacterium]